MGLRWKSGLWLAALLALLSLFALLAGRAGLDAFRDHFGAGFARNHALLQAQKLVTLITRELSLSQRLAELESVRRFLRGGDASGQAGIDAERFRRAFTDASVFLIAHDSGHYYFSDGAAPDAWVKPSYTLQRGDPKDGWYFATVRDARPYALNVNVDEKLKVTKVWFNVLVREDEGGRILGLAGSGLDLTRFLATFVGTVDSGVTNFIINGDGAILAHPDESLIEYAALTKAAPRRTLHGLVEDGADRKALDGMLAGLREAPGSGGGVLRVDLQGQPRVLGAAYVPELDWYVITAVDLGAAQVIDETVLWPLALGAIALLLLFAAAVSMGVDRLILRPLVRLTDSARRIAAGDYRQRLRTRRSDELGSLTRAFDGMARQIDAHTSELESRVAERTRDLAQARDRIAATHRQIQDSIRYAGLIQHAMLPQRELLRALPDDHFVLWQPRDTVGGDFYLFREAPGQFLVGIVDCAGHGVPGAFMTMIAHAGFDLAVQELGLSDPAALLRRMDSATRTLLPGDAASRHLATNMDVGLCHLDLATGRVTFAGAHADLYRCEGTRCEQIRGSRRSIGERRRAIYENVILADGPGCTYYLTTDGFLDQAGGERGYGFGNRRFADALGGIAAQPMKSQEEALRRRLADHQGSCPQRDDITVIGFRIPGRAAAPGPVSGE